MSASLHQFTPSLTAIDPRGLDVRQVAYHRSKPSQAPEARISRQVFGASGLLLEQWDPRLGEMRPSGAQPNQARRYSLSGQPLLTRSIDAGWRVMWRGGAGQLLDVWDGRRSHQQHQYDHLMRPMAVFERTVEEPRPRCVERLIYAPGAPDAARRNACGRVIRHDDPAGTVFYEHFGLWGRPLSVARRFCNAQTVDWPLSEGDRHLHLEAPSYLTTWHYNAAGDLLAQTDAKDNRLEHTYGVDGQLAATRLIARGGRPQWLVDQRRYNAGGQIESERAGNGVVSRTRYNEADGRVLGMTSRIENTLLQDLAYQYDRVGNVVTVTDSAQPVRWSSNTRVDPVQAYRYDTLYQLVEASGRENSSNAAGVAPSALVTFGTDDGSQVRQYVRHYSYDAGGNLTRWRHVPSCGSGYTHTMVVASRSNHALSGGTSPGLGSGFDANGNLDMLVRGQPMHWNARNQLARVTQVLRDEAASDDESYVYDSAGARAIKRRRYRAYRVEHTEEVRYLPGLEIRRNSATGEQLNVVNADIGGQSVRVLCWEQHPTVPALTIQSRFNLRDHLGSSTLELDENGQVLSQESYYPYGATAWWAARNATEASYKTLRYSGKERDASGLYSYGLRYYAPWLMRWINPDPAGAEGGWNLYAMVAGNPISQVDPQGATPTRRRGSLDSGVASMTSASPVSMTASQRFQAAASAGVRDYLAADISLYIGVALDQLFEATAATPRLNQALRGVVASLDGLAVGHMTAGLAGRTTSMAYLLGAIAAMVTAIGFALHTEDSASEETWDPIARARLVGHVRALSRELGQQVMRGLGTDAPWGDVSVSNRLPRVGFAAVGYSMATVANAMYGLQIPGPLQSNISPAIEAFDGLVGTAIRSGHGAVSANPPSATPIQPPDRQGLFHGGMTRMFAQVFSFWSGVAIEAVSAAVTGLSPERQGARARSVVAAARGIASGLTEFRGVLMAAARGGFARRTSWLPSITARSNSR
ncbi:RHS repeat-associated core domain-containing protein [Pseudomonas sp. SAICEU22]|uniref:RHS repeat-associated core domain-containing protein n=1 Tax=Pseudomonas agronomica TaxID=2979328 RepID=A0ABT3F541_9PSED|nr:RHS repeat-associated core domain-containing protein [Pseudomonas agronomica]MCW1243909.1 RHS repeat-associated core domain-containing protein [Pseudomonas agronomica]